MTRPLLPLLLLLWMSPAHGYDAQPTHLGMTERAVYASTLHGVLLHDWARPLGLYEPLAGKLPADLAKRVAQLSLIDGLCPDGQGRNTALGWLLAGAALEDFPISRARNHFYDPKTKRGLHDTGNSHNPSFYLFGSHEAGGPMDVSGEAAPDWAVAAPSRNELGMGAWVQALEESALAATPAERDAALVRALLSLGALTHLLEDMGSPSRVRNDFRRAHLETVEGSSLWDKRSSYERFVALSYGRYGIPAPAGPAENHPRLRDFFNTLSSFVQSSFFSPGSLPPSIRLEHGRQQAHRAIERAMPYPEPKIFLTDTANGAGNLYSPKGNLLGKYEIRAAVLNVFLDADTHAAYAKLLLPRTVQAAAGLIQFLLRGQLEVSKDGDAWTVKNRGTPLARGTLQLLLEDRSGRRKKIGVPQRIDHALAAGAEIARTTLPAGSASRLIALFSGQDEAGEPLVAIEDLAIPSAPPPVSADPPKF